MNWRNGDAVEPVPAMALSANYFRLLGVNAWLGRTFTPQDAAPDVVVRATNSGSAASPAIAASSGGR